MKVGGIGGKVGEWKSDVFEDCEQILDITPIFLTIVITFSY